MAYWLVAALPCAYHNEAHRKILIHKPPELLRPFATPCASSDSCKASLSTTKSRKSISSPVRGRGKANASSLLIGHFKKALNRAAALSSQPLYILFPYLLLCMSSSRNKRIATMLASHVLPLLSGAESSSAADIFLFSTTLICLASRRIMKMNGT